MMAITNKEAGISARRRETFTGGNLFGEKFKDKLYVSYSYGYHFPMYVYDYEAGKWIGNKDKYSRTTSRHQSLCRPYTVDHWLDTEEMRLVVQKGLAGYIAWKMIKDIRRAA
jgi:hypothetical protein